MSHTLQRHATAIKQIHVVLQDALEHSSLEKVIHFLQLVRMAPELLESQPVFRKVLTVHIPIMRDYAIHKEEATKANLHLYDVLAAEVEMTDAFLRRLREE
jgi:hypothetical protein